MAWVVRVRDARAVDALAGEAAAVELDGDDVLALYRDDDAARVRRLAEAALDGAGVTAPLGLEEPEWYDWDSVWRPSVHALRVGPLYLAPDGVDAPGARFLEVGRAFGSGGHATTRLCLEALAERPPAGRVLDVGAGNGILALAAVWVGAEGAVGTETDAEARAVAVRNVARHGLDGRVAIVEDFTEGERFARIVCNVPAGPLRDLAPRLVRALASGGEAHLAGFTASQVDDVARAYRHLGASVVIGGERDGWLRLDVLAPW